MVTQVSIALPPEFVLSVLSKQFALFCVQWHSIHSEGTVKKDLLGVKIAD